MENNDSIAIAFGLTDEWAHESKAQAFKSWDKEDKVSDMFETHLNGVHQNELGETEGLSEYERKVYMSGFHMGVVVAERKIMERLLAQHGDVVLSTMIKGLKSND
jgi:hypothetical protein